MPDGHVLFIAPSAYPLGGVATWLDYVVPGLRRHGWQVTLGLAEGVYHDVDAYLDVHPFDGIVRIAPQTGSQEGRIRALCNAISAVQPDVVAGVNIGDVYPAVNRLKHAALCKPRSVMTLHGIELEYYQQIAHGAPSLDGVVATNRLACRLASTLGGIDPERVFYAPYGVTAPERSVAAARPDAEALRIGFVGRLQRPQKRVEDLVAIVAELERKGAPNELVIAGSGPEEGWLRDALHQSVSNGWVRFRGTLTRDELETAVYPSLDALLITSRWETGPIVAWEAMAHGVPVVTSGYIGMGAESSLRHGENCLIFPVGDAIAAAECLMRLREPALRQRLIDHGRALVRDRYSQDVSVRRWSECFSRIVTMPRRPAAPQIDIEPAGRLDRLFGTRNGENFRRLLRFRQVPAEAGAEWPHISVQTPAPSFDFWETARAADRAVA